MAKAPGCRFEKKQGGIRSKRRQATPMVPRGHQVSALLSRSR
jgi:hypothetical protein